VNYEETDLHAYRMLRAFDIVDPSSSGRVGATWRDPIHTNGTKAAIEALCQQQRVTLDDVMASVEFFTGMKAVMERYEVDGQPHLRITSPGYSAGNAGDY
jgi:hypothetical protein